MLVNLNPPLVGIDFGATNERRARSDQCGAWQRARRDVIREGSRGVVRGMNGAIKARLLITASVMLVLGAIGAALAFASGGGSGADDGLVEITMTDGAIDVDSSTLTAGLHTFAVTNEGAAEHEVVVLRTDKPADELPVGLHGVSIELAGELILGEDHVASKHGHKPGQVLGLLPGRSQRYQVELKPGSYVVYCQTGSHYLAGERTTFTVE